MATPKCKKGEFYLLRAAYANEGGRRQYVSTLNGEKHLVESFLLLLLADRRKEG